MPTSSVFKVVRLLVYIYAFIFLTGEVLVPIFLISGNIFSIAPPPPLPGSTGTPP